MVTYERVPTDGCQIAMIGGVIFPPKASQHFVAMSDCKGCSFVAVNNRRIIMKKSINDNRKMRGWPATGTAPLVGVRMTEDFQGEIKAWSKKQPDQPPLATAIRRLVELGLTVKPKSTPAYPLRSKRASELAGKVIDSLTLGGVDVEEKASRKRRLLKGPEEFREARVDRPKAKGK